MVGRRGARWVELLALSAVTAGCASPAAPTFSDAASEPSRPTGSPARPTVDPSPVVPSAAPSVAPAPHVVARPFLTPSEVEEVLFAEPAQRSAAGAACPQQEREARARCLLEKRMEGDAEATKLAVDLFERTGDVAGVERDHEMDGGFRGRIRIVSEPPVGRHRKHLAWVAEATRDYDDFFAAIGARAQQPLTYRWSGIAFKFLRSVGRTTPSAYAQGWSIGYNVSGSLHGSADAVRETLFHEIFHLNDAARQGWSARVLGPLYDEILSACRGAGAAPASRTGCLAPYAPSDTMLRGGTYYAFSPGNGVEEYGAELAIRYYREHRAILAEAAEGTRFRDGAAGPARVGRRSPFKCGPAVNARAWTAMSRDFFGGVDLVSPCGKGL